MSLNWARRNPDKKRASDKAYYAHNTKKVKAAVRKWTKANYSKVLAGKRIRYANSPDSARNTHLKKHFNITLEEWEKILAYQNGVCAICRRPQSEFKTRLATDHDHSTHIVRGLLCIGCNSIIPTRINVHDLFQRITEYLANPPAVAALGAPRLANPVKRRKRK